MGVAQSEKLTKIRDGLHPENYLCDLSKVGQLAMSEMQQCHVAQQSCLTL